MNKTISPVEFIRRVIKKSELGKHFKLMPFQGDFAFGKRLAPLIVAALTFLTFLPVLWNEFLTIFDDNINLVFNDQYRGLGWTQLKWMFTTLYNGHYRPLTWVTFGLDYLIWEMN